jgi:HSP20 family protein
MLTLWSPFSSERGLTAIEREIDRMFRDVARPRVTTPGARFAPADVVETKDALFVKMDLPGVDPAAIKVGIENDVLTISAERKAPASNGELWHRSEIGYGTVSRSFSLPATVDTNRTEARYDAGVLILTLPKREEAKPRTIEVKVG